MAETVKPKRFDFGPKVPVRFTNVENPGVGIDFNFQGRKFSLKDGDEVDLPQAVVDHLNSLIVPESRYEEVNGQVRSVLVNKNRFAVIPQARKAA